MLQHVHGQSLRIFEDDLADYGVRRRPPLAGLHQELRPVHKVLPGVAQAQPGVYTSTDEGDAQGEMKSEVKG